MPKGIAPSQRASEFSAQQLVESADVATKVQNCQLRQRIGHDHHAKGRKFAADDKVFVKNFGTGSAWLPETIVGERGPLSYQINLDDGREIRRHVDHVRTRSCDSSVEINQEPGVHSFSDWNLPSTGDTASNGTHQPALLRRSNRVRRAPDRLTY